MSISLPFYTQILNKVKEIANFSKTLTAAETIADNSFVAINYDGKVNLIDLNILAAEWLRGT